MKNLIFIFLASLFMGFSGAIMPGPLLTVTVNDAFKHGPWYGAKLVFGHAILELFLVIAIFAGLGSVIRLNLFKGVIGVVGGLFLLWMGWGMLQEAKTKTSGIDISISNASNGLHPFLKGITVSAANPYWSLWWITVGSSSLLLASNNGLEGIVFFFSGHILADFSWYTFVSFTVSKGKSIITPQIYRLILLICGLFLSGLSIYFIYTGFVATIGVR